MNHELNYEYMWKKMKQQAEEGSKNAYGPEYKILYRCILDNMNSVEEHCEIICNSSLYSNMDVRELLGE